MARDHIKIDTTNAATSPLAQSLKSYVQQLRLAFNTGEQIVAQMSHMNDGTNFTDIETIFGLPAGKGQAVFDLVNGAQGSMKGNFQVDDAKQITEQLV